MNPSRPSLIPCLSPVQRTACVLALVLVGLFALSAAQASAAPTSTAAPVISGLVKGGQVVTASTGTWTTPTETSLTYAYQWQLSPTGVEGSWTNSTNSGNATATHLILLADATKYLRVCVTASDGDTATACTTGVVIANEPYPTRIFTQAGWSVLSDATSRVSYWNPNQDWNGFSSNGTTNYWSGWYTAPAAGGTGVSVPNSDWSRSALIDDQYLYRNNSGATIARSNIDGSDYRPNFVTGLNVRDRKILARGKNYLYYRAGANGDMMGRAPITGGASENDFMPAGMNENSGIAVGSDYIYWGRGSCIARADITGTGVENCWVNASFGRNSPVRGMGIDQNALYFFFWPYDGPGYGYDKGLVRVNLDGTGLMRLAGTSGDATPISVAQAAGAAGPLPVNAGGADAPTISGTARTGNTLTVAAGSWTNTPASYTYRWLVSNNGSTGWSVASGATTTSSYVIPEGYVGKYLQARVIAHNGSTWSEAAYTDAVWVPAPPVNSVRPAVTGSVKVGASLSAGTGTWTNPPADASGYAYQWQVSADNSVWDAATGTGNATSSYVPVAAEYGSYLRVKVTATNGGGSVDATSTSSVVLPVAPVSSVAPAVTGTVQVGQTLSADTGTWASQQEPTGYAYQWQASADDAVWGSAAGAGNATSSYVPVASEYGSHLRVKVTATNSGGSTDATSTSSVVLPVAPVSSVAPAVTGTVQVGQTLSADTGSWTSQQEPTTYVYEWQVSANGTDGWATAAGTGNASSSYVPDASEYGEYLRVQVTATNDGGSTDALSAVSSVVLPVAPVSSVAPVVTGMVQVGETLSVDTGTWTSQQAPTTYVYEWQVSTDGADWTAALGDGGDSSDYDVDLTDDNKYLRVKVTATNDGGSTDGYSVVTSLVDILAPTSAAVPVVSGTVEIGRTLTASTGTWDFATDYAYVWQSSADGSTWLAAPGVGAATSSYTVAAADAGRYLRVRVTGSNRIDALVVASDASVRVPSPASPAVDTPPVVTPVPVFSPAPGITVGETRGEAVLAAAVPAAGADLLRGANIWVRPTSKVEYVASALPAGLKLVNGKLVATKPGTYQVTIKVKSAKGIIRMRTIKIKVG